jgi:hypothetical protein
MDREVEGERSVFGCWALRCECLVQLQSTGNVPFTAKDSPWLISSPSFCRTFPFFCSGWPWFSSCASWLVVSLGLSSRYVHRPPFLNLTFFRLLPSILDLMHNSKLTFPSPLPCSISFSFSSPTRLLCLSRDGVTATMRGLCTIAGKGNGGRIGDRCSGLSAAILIYHVPFSFV